MIEIYSTAGCEEAANARKLCDNFNLVYLDLPISDKTKIDWIYKIGAVPKTSPVIFVNGRHAKKGYTDLSHYVMFGAMPK